MAAVNRQLNVTPALREIFNRRIAREAQTQSLRERFLKHRRQADRNALFEAYAPWVKIIAIRLKVRRPAFYRDDLCDLIQNGSIGLLSAIDHFESRGLAFYTFAWRGIRQAIHRGQHTMNRRGEREATIHRIRGELIQRHGRLPSEDEMTVALRGVISNPSIQVGDCPLIDADRPQTREPTPDRMAIDRETIKLAMKGLQPLDRKIFKLLLKGKSDAEIARSLGVSRQRIGQRLNGLLWEARSRADLAAYFGVQPEQPPTGAKRGNLPSPAKFPPARLAVSA